MDPMPQLFRAEDCVPINHTRIGIGGQRRRPRNIKVYDQLIAGPFLAAFDAGLYEAP